jgi:hypothetical protein
MLLEGAEASFERMEHRLHQLRGLTGVKRVLEQYTLTKDMALQLGRPGQDAPVPEHNSWICADNKKPRQSESRGFSFSVHRRYSGCVG